MKAQTVKTISSEKVFKNSENRRQDIRVDLPGCFKLNGSKQTYKILNISVSGVCIRTGKNLAARKNQDIILFFPLQNASFYIRLESRQVYFDKERNVAGFRFTNLSERDHIVLESLVKNYLAGIITVENGVIDALSKTTSWPPAAEKTSSGFCRV